MIRTALMASITTGLITGCAGTPPCEPIEIKIPVPVSCVTTVPVRPESKMAQLADTATDFEKIQALTIDFIAQKQYVNELNAVIEGCR